MIRNNINNKRTRFSLLLNLAFLVIGCSEKNDETSVTLRWQGSKAVGVVVRGKLIQDLPHNAVGKQLHINLAGNPEHVLGTYEITADSLLFTPAIPFTHGLKYDVIVDEKKVAGIDVPLVSDGNPPAIVNVYPSADTLPENLLKIYIVFNKSMQEGHSLQHLTIIKNDRDTLRDVFADLQLELWNEDRTVLAVWLDPGRIKRDLQPNLKMGPPLVAGNHYKLIISRDWPDVDGNMLKTSFEKNFVAVSRDEHSPAVNSWMIKEPVSANDKLEVGFLEPLDYILIKSAIFIVDENKNDVKGSIYVNEDERGFTFKPSSPWKKGTYTIESESRLEDLAGNNLNRPFDKDLTKKDTGDSSEVIKRSFVVK